MTEEADYAGFVKELTELSMRYQIEICSADPICLESFSERPDLEFTHYIIKSGELLSVYQNIEESNKSDPQELRERLKQHIESLVGTGVLEEAVTKNNKLLQKLKEKHKTKND